MREYLIAEQGYLWTNGEIYGSIIYLAEGVSKDSFYLVTFEEYEQMKEQEEMEVIE